MSGDLERERDLLGRLGLQSQVEG